jgi:hypothetical protein
MDRALPVFLLLGLVEEITAMDVNALLRTLVLPISMFLVGIIITATVSYFSRQSELTVTDTKLETRQANMLVRLDALELRAHELERSALLEINSRSLSARANEDKLIGVVQDIGEIKTELKDIEMSSRATAPLNQRVEEVSKQLQLQIGNLRISIHRLEDAVMKSRRGTK